jgi:adenine-specific DNA-methyltransferase
MPKRRVNNSKRPIESYEHRDKQRVNNPPVGLVNPDTDPYAGVKKGYAYDPHLDPQLQWAGKAEHTSFEVPTVSLHVHERIDPRTIIEAVGKGNGDAGAQQLTLFETERKEPLRQAVEFYKHAHGWSNRLVAGDSLLVMNSLLEKEGMAGKVQMIYIDPPYGIRYGSNFQPFVNKRDVKDGKDEDLTAEPEQIRAFRDTWELGIHSYLTYLRDRLLLARELLTESGSIFVQISDENVHHVRELLDEVLGSKNFIALIVFAKSGGTTSEYLSSPNDFLLWYARDKSKLKYRQIFHEKETGPSGQTAYNKVELPDGTRRQMTKEEFYSHQLLPLGSKIYRIDNLTSQGYRVNTTISFQFEGQTFHPGTERNWKTTVEGLNRLALSRRLQAHANGLYYPKLSDLSAKKSHLMG